MSWRSPTMHTNTSVTIRATRSTLARAAPKVFSFSTAQLPAEVPADAGLVERECLGAGASGCVQGSRAPGSAPCRSEERRVGKECRTRGEAWCGEDTTCGD